MDWPHGQQVSADTVFLDPPGGGPNDSSKATFSLDDFRVDIRSLIIDSFKISNRGGGESHHTAGPSASNQ